MKLRDDGMTEIEIACAFARMLKLAQEEYLELIEHGADAAVTDAEE